MKLSNKVYDIFKWLGLAFFPALAILLSTILPVWGVDAGLVKALVVTCNGLGVFIAALIGISQATIAKENLEMIEAMDDNYEEPAVEEEPVTEEEENDKEI